MQNIDHHHTAYIGLGANLGDAQQTVRAAIIELSQLRATQLTRSSRLYLSAPVNADGDDYINAVVELHTQQSPAELFSALQKLEAQFGRVRTYQNAPRTLDLDLLLYDQSVINTTALQIPHPRMSERAFVIVPLLEIAPTTIIPGMGSAQSLLPHLKNQVIHKIGEPSWPATLPTTQSKN